MLKRSIRPQPSNLTLGHFYSFFLEQNGTKMQSRYIKKAIKSVWEKAGIDGPIHGTLLRKGAVTAVHRNHEKEASNLADLMAHKEDTTVQ